MKINIIEGLGMHMICLGFLLEIFKQHDVVLYLRNDHHKYCDFYKSIQNFETVFFQNLVLRDADLTIKLTSNDYCIDNENIVSILHLDSNRNQSKKFISLTPFISGLNIIYLFPCYNTISHLSYSSDTICYIGCFMKENLDYDLEFFIKNSNFNFKFIVSGYHNYDFLTKYSNVEVYRDLITVKLVEYLKESKFILSRKSPHQTDDRFSGALAWSVTLKKPIILQEKYSKLYGIPCVTFKENYSETINNIQSMSENNYVELVNNIEKFRDYNININSKKLLDFCNLKNTCMMIEPRILSDIDTIFINARKILGDNWNYVFYCGKTTKTHWMNILPDYVELRPLDVDNFDNAIQHSNFCKTRSLWDSMTGEFVLTIQADTWITDSSTYTIDNFIKLNKSYIASNMNFLWPHIIRENIHPINPNFNGGLSLRKRLDMIKIIDNFPPINTDDRLDNCVFESYPEDVYFTVGCYKLNLPIGDDEYSSHFSLHKVYKDDFFGIHQPCQTIKSQINEKMPLLKNLNSHLKL
jgi:hypothetical protein